MRVLHLDAGREMRGGQWQALHLIEGLAAAGHRNQLLAPRASPLFTVAREKGMDVRPLTWGAVVRFSRSAGLTHAHDARSHTLAVVARATPLVVSRRVAFPIRRGALSRWKYRQADHYIAVSRFVARRLEESGVPEERITVVYDGVPGFERQAPRGDYVLALDTDDPQKGTALLREAGARVGLPLRLTRNLRAALPGSGIFACITYEEGLGSAALLAMAAGVPVVASRTGGLPEAIEDGVTGLLVDNTVESIAAALLRLHQDPGLAAGLAAAARARAEERFTTSVMVRETMRVYERVLGCGKAG